MACGLRFRQFSLLMWKNFLLHRRKIIVLLFEIALPTVLIMLPLGLQKAADRDKMVQNATLDPSSPFSSRLTLYANDMLSFVPNSSIPTSIMNDVINRIPKRINSFLLTGPIVNNYSTIQELEAAKSKWNLKNNKGYYTSHKFIAVIFDLKDSASTGLPKEIKYTIRMHRSSEWKTRLTHPTILDSSGFMGDEYRDSYFLEIQQYIDEAIIKFASGQNALNISISMKPMPRPSSAIGYFTQVLIQLLPIVIFLSYAVHSNQIVRKVVTEKEKKLKETMKMMGLPSYLHWTAWTVDYFLIITASAIIQLLVIKFGGLLPNANAFIIFLLMVCWTFATIFFSFALSTFFNSAKTAVLVQSFLYLLTCVPYFVIGQREIYDTLTRIVKIPLCLLPNFALGMGMQQICLLELSGSGVQWDMISKTTTLPDDISLLDVFLMLILDSFLYMFVAWYKDTVAPGDFGIPQPWYFLCMPSYWRGPRVESQMNNNRTSNGKTANENFESDPELLPSISLQNLTKQFGRGSKKKLAVNKMNFNIYEGQITALLGHNGAGKTTTMSMIAGFLPPSSGTAFVCGLDIRRNIDEIRQSLGLCPQHDVLFDLLTVYEHMYFFGKLKGCQGAALEKEINRMLEATKLKDKKNERAKTLSGGMKRRLSVALALIGGSKIVILDEPSSGLDPESRRELWTFLQAERHDRTMLLSTHFMDEADNLSDRIGIMAAGELQCVGTPLFLKSRYGAGYHLTILKKSHCVSEEVAGFIKRFCVDANLESDVSQELKILLPSESSQHFEEMFTALEEKRDILGIESYGISITTMEEVFLKVGEIAERNADDVFEKESRNSSTYELQLTDDEHKATGCMLLLGQLYGIITKRFQYYYRSFIILLIQLVMPMLFTVFAFLTIQNSTKSVVTTTMPALTLKFDSRYFPQNVYYGNDFNQPLSAYEQDIMTRYKNTFKSPFVKTVKGFNSTQKSFLEMLLNIGESDNGKYYREYLVGAIFTNSTSPGYIQIHGLYNRISYHTAPISLNHISNAILGHFKPGYQITAVNHPYPTSYEVYGRGRIYTSIIELIMMIGFAIMVATLTLVIVRERVSKTKLLHLVSGVHPLVYWLTNMLWDYICYLVACVPVMIFVSAYQSPFFKATEQILGLLTLLLFYGWATIPLVYLTSYLFKNPASAVAWSFTGNILTVLITVNVVEIASYSNSGRMDSSSSWAFSAFLPNFCLANGVGKLFRNHANLKACNETIVKNLCANTVTVSSSNPYAGSGGQMSCCENLCSSSTSYSCTQWNLNYFGMREPGIGRELLFMAIQGVIFFLFCVYTTSALASKLGSALSPAQQVARSMMRRNIYRNNNMSLNILQREDSDVRAARDDAVSGARSRHEVSLSLQQLTHFYGTHCAVDELTCSIKKGECFGLLGVNGAGKTTTFRMLTGDLSITGGDAFVLGNSVRQNPARVYKKIGYCPQFDAHADLLTGREMLFLYGRLRGVEERLLKTTVHKLINDVTLDKYANKRAATYSGGNKRKLSAALALIGSPDVVFLDEPTTGVDPEARRHLWNTLSAYRANNKTLILTSHSMEECEALCTKVAIMVNGRFKCFGSVQRLKEKFGHGYTLFAQIPFSVTSPENDMVLQFKQFVKEKFPSSELKDEHQGLLHYQLHPQEGMTCGNIFGVLEKNRSELSLENYSVSQPTLEQIFIQFARSQKHEEKQKRLGKFKICCLWMGCKRQKLKVPDEHVQV